MWASLLFPDWVVTYFVHIVFAIGVIGTLVGTFLNKIPFINQYGMIIKSISVVLLIVGLYLEGGLQNEMAWRSKVAEYEKRIEAAQVASNEANVIIQEKVVETVKIIKENTNANNQAIEANSTAINSVCKLSDTAWMLYNRASQNGMANSSK
jgi:hypothetical protein